KLFFFVNYEGEKTPGQAVKYRAADDINGETGGSGLISRTKMSEMQKVADFVKQRFGYDPGSYTDYPADESNHRLLARLDWNITDAHHLSVRYNNTKNVAWNGPNGNSADTGYRLNGTYRVGVQSMAFSNSMYSMENKVQSLSADLHSRFGQKISNQLLFTYTNIEDMRGSNSSEFPFIDIMAGKDANGNQIMEPYMSLGYELFTYNNGVKNKITSVTDNFTLYLAAHKITAGLSFEHQLANNAYMRNGTGYYRYNSVEDFLNQARPESFAITYGFNGKNDPNAQVTFNQLGFYAQDEWNVTDKLKLTYGVRFDNLAFDNDDLATNKAIYAIEFRDGQHVDTGKWPDSHLQISPRLGFTYDVFGDKSLKVRGGTGIFTGRLPLVFFTNMPTNANMVQNSVTYTTT
ncbi:MAG: TonB-dependent receptor, partial [Prevotella sp.]|nr:TonB-dependent receptor [Prevotella sp.]